MSKPKFKTRSTYYQRQMSDAVKFKCKEVAKEMGIAQWLVVEMILENAFNISNENTIDVNKWLGTKNKNKVGKAWKKKRV